MNNDQTERMIMAVQYIKMTDGKTPLDIVITANMFGVSPLRLIGVLEANGEIPEGATMATIQSMAENGKTEEDMIEQASIKILVKVLAPMAREMHNIWAKRMAGWLSSSAHMEMDGSVRVLPADLQSLLARLERNFDDLPQKERAKCIESAQSALKALGLIDLGLNTEPAKEA